MIKLLEYQGKALLSQYDIPVPAGTLWPGRPENRERVVVKAQIPAGKRGKHGGVLFADTNPETDLAARKLLDTTLAGWAVEKVLVEERLEIERELYLAVVVDRDHSCRVLLASAKGGVDIESVPQSEISRQLLETDGHIDPRTLTNIMGTLGPGAPEKLGPIVEALCRLAHAEDTLVAEINPLVLTTGGDFVAADAKVVLDGRAAFRHPDWLDLETSLEGTAFERRVGQLGGIASEIDPNGTVVLIVSGAGPMMATFDRLVDNDVPVRAVVDLGGMTMRGAAGMTPIFNAAFELGAPVLFFSSYFQTGRGDLVARGIADACQMRPADQRLMARLQGNHGEEGRTTLAKSGFEVFEDLEVAIGAVASQTRKAR